MQLVEPAPPWPPFLPDRQLLQAAGGGRREAGRQHFSEALLFLLRYVSHPQLSELADWACNEPGNLHTSQISHMRNNKVRMLGTKAVDALGRINQAAWVQRHRPELLAELGTAPLTPRLSAILNAYQPLLDPISQEPLGSGALMAIYLGYLRLPIAQPRSLSAEQAGLLAGLIGEWFDAALSARGLGFRAATRRVQLAWPGEKAGAERLVRVIGGLEDYSAKQLTADWERIAIVAAAVLERPSDPWALADELLAIANANAAAATAKAKANTASKFAAQVTPIRSKRSKPSSPPAGPGADAEAPPDAVPAVEPDAEPPAQPPAKRRTPPAAPGQAKGGAKLAGKPQPPAGGTAKRRRQPSKP
jgi:hypothetical protein